MAGICPVCGEKVGGLMGMPKPGEDMKKRGESLGVYQEGMCAICLSRAIRGKAPKKTEEEINKEVQTIADAVPKMFSSPSPVPAAGEDRGLVTGYCILGTGPLTSLFSAVTDTFGMKSNAYLEKARTAEKEALSMMKLEALKLGADAVYRVRINLTEATSGNGMLMVSVSGAAVKTAAPAPEIVKAIEMLDGNR